MKLRTLLATILTLLIFLTSCQRDLSTAPTDDDLSSVSDSIKVVYAGVRSSNYGISPFPDPSGWQNAIQTMSSYSEESIPSVIWILGVMDGSTRCHLEFPSDGNSYTNITFQSTDKHESYLSHFDNMGIQVYLQVEPANANINDLIDLVLNRYKHHPCVIGFGIDIEWYREAENPDWGVKVDDATAMVWETWVKSHNANYNLFLKHWDRGWMPPTYRGDIIFVDDSQIFPNAEAFLDEMTHYWADHFKSNMVFFQIGYSSDKSWWQAYENPPRDLSQLLSDRTQQQCGIFWVDFTLKEVLPTTAVSL